MKKILCIFLTAVMLICSFCFFADAKTTYKATWVMTANVNGKSYNSGTEIPVKPGDSVKVNVHLSNNYYTGPTCFQLFYTPTVIARASDSQFNTNGKLYGVCGKTWCTMVDWERVAQGNRNQGWPKYNSDEQLAQFKATHQFLRVTMTPNVLMTTTAVKDINEDLITITFDVAKNAAAGAIGEIVLPKETMRTKNYTSGYFYSGIYTTSDMLGEYMMYSDDQVFDCSKTTLKFKVVGSSSLGDVNKDGKINSADSLMVLQSAVGSLNLTAEQKTLADVNKDKNVNSVDALKILQYAVGIINKF